MVKYSKEYMHIFLCIYTYICMGVFKMLHKYVCIDIDTNFKGEDSSLGSQPNKSLKCQCL